MSSHKSAEEEQHNSGDIGRDSELSEQQQRQQHKISSSVVPPPVMPPSSSTTGLIKTAMTTTTTTTTDPHASFRPAGQQEELEALRQRGLAKLLNRHFTEATQKIAQEKAAAEAALRDLEERKLQYQHVLSAPASPNRGLSQIEELYHKVHKWRNECRQKEKETLLLYQRYVDKFGGTGHVQVPEIANETPTTTPVPAPSTQAALPPNASSDVAASVQHLEDSLKRQREQGNHIVIPSPVNESFATLNAKEEADFRDFYRHQMEKVHVSLRSKAAVRTSAEGGPEMPVPQEEEKKVASSSSSSSSEEENEDEDEDNDISSLISGLTSINSTTTRRLIQDCEQTVQTFLEEESKAVQAMLSVAGSKISKSHSKNNSKKSARSGSNAIGSLQTQAATEAENMVKQMQGILQDFEEKQKTVSTDAHQARPYYTSNPEEKWMVYYDETFQRDYYHEVHTNRTQWEPPINHADVTDATSLSTVEHASSVLAHVDVMPEVQKGRSLIAEYRKKSRRRRKKRLVFVAAVAFTVACAGVVVVQTQPELVESLREQLEPVRLRFEPTRVALLEWVETVRSSLFDVPASRKVVALPVETPQPAPLPVLVAEKPTEVKRQEEQESEEFRRKVAEEAAHKRAEEARRKRQAKALAEAAAEAARLEYLRRPFGCNLPFAYLLHRRCYRLASENPLYSAYDLAQSMMQ